jgi:hypothetical protein
MMEVKDLKDYKIAWLGEKTSILLLDFAKIKICATVPVAWQRSPP